MKITLITDNQHSWIIPFVKKIKSDMSKRHKVRWVKSHKDVKRGELAFWLSCEKIAKPDILSKNRHNLVVHESALPKGRGWSPLTWQILKGKNRIPVTLLEAEDKVDSGDIYLQQYIEFSGHELVEELRKKQGDATVKLVMDFTRMYPNVKSLRQKGKATFYNRRTPVDSELDINKTIKEQFDLLRVVDNDRYPAFFKHRGHTYKLKIYKEK